MPKETYAERGRVVRSDETPEERRDAARRRLQVATAELQAGIKPANLIRKSPGIAVGAGVVGLLFVRRILRSFRRPRPVTIIREVPVGYPAAGPVPTSQRRMEKAAEKGANKSARNMIIGAIMTALIGVLRERVLAPNIEKYVAPNVERWTNDLMMRFTGGQDQPGKDDKRQPSQDDRRPATTTYRA